MAKEAKERFLKELGTRSPSLRKLPKSQSLYDIEDGAARIYVRYSKRHPGNRTFYGLRTQDLRELEGRPSFICFLWDEQIHPLIIPFAEYEEIFHATPPAPDAQYKSQVFLHSDGTELYIANAGRFNVESYFGWESLETQIDLGHLRSVPEFTHSQVQTLLGAIGSTKGYDVWIPPGDRGQLDWSLASRFDCRKELPGGFDEVANILREIDVVWVARGANELRSLFEVEHSTPVYSALLRFNDVHLVAPRLEPRFSIVANDVRRSVFVRQLNRPTFRTSGLREICSFLEYVNVYGWYQRLTRCG